MSEDLRDIISHSTFFAATRNVVKDWALLSIYVAKPTLFGNCFIH
jgi:hypothetical protein